jgi:hypothetical protein
VEPRFLLEVSQMFPGIGLQDPPPKRDLERE